MKFTKDEYMIELRNLLALKNPCTMCPGGMANVSVNGSDGEAFAADGSEEECRMCRSIVNLDETPDLYYRPASCPCYISWERKKPSRLLFWQLRHGNTTYCPESFERG